MNGPTDQFSQEYIAFILSDEAKGLQGKWQELGVGSGQAVIGTNVSNWYALGLVHRHMTLSTEGDVLSGWAVSEVLSGYLHWHCNKEKRIWENWAWLPALWDPLQIIERAGYHWERQGTALLACREVGYHADTDEIEWEVLREDIHGDLMLAAAKLAVRAITNRE